VLRLSYGTAWIVDGGDELQLELPPEGQLTRLEAGINGEQVAIARTDKVNDVWSSEVFMYTIGDPAPLWSQPLAIRAHGVWISDDGTVSGNVYWDSPGDALGFIIHDGQAIEFPEFFPISPLVQDSIAAIRELPGPGDELGWIDLALNWYPVEFPPINSHYRRLDIDQHTHEYVADIDGTLTFIRAARDGIELLLPLPPEAENRDILAAGNYRLIKNNMAGIRIDVDLAEAVYVNPAPPPGWDYYQCGDVSINPNGALLYALTDGVVAQMWGYDVDSDEWWAFGKPWGHIQALMFFPKSDNLLAVVGIPLPEDLILPCSAVLDSEPPPGTLIGDVGQLLNSATGFQMDMDYSLKNWGHHMTFDSQERCVYLGLAQQTSLVRPVDDSGLEVDFGDNYRWYWLD
jgi:hypothetical protein